MQEKSEGFFEVRRRTAPSGVIRRLLKWIFGLLLLSVLLLALGLAGIVGYYRTIVAQKPGALVVDHSPGPLLGQVDPFIGTGGVPWVCAYNSPAAAVPFGMVRLGPDTASMLWDIPGLNSSGYFYGDNKILGFSHNRLLGADAFDGGNFRIFPTVESKTTTARSKPKSARFSHRDEIAFPGYYAVALPSEKVLVELTASPRVGVHRYTFEAGEVPRLLIDVSSSLGDARTRDASVRILPASNEIEGSVKNLGSFSGRYGGLQVFFVARFNQPLVGFGTWKGEEFESDREAIQGDEIAAEAIFDPAGEATPIEVRVAISHVSLDNARLNLEAEAAGRSFEEILDQAKADWEGVLSRIQIEGGSERERRIFFTALYRAFQMPTLFNDANGEYLGFDQQVHTAEGFRYYTDFSLWDTFRTVHPLYTLIAMKDQRDMIISLVEMAKAGGCLPRWPSGAGYTNCMIGTPADMMVSEAYLKGVRDFDVETAYAKMRQTALDGPPEGTKFAGRQGLEGYLELGYCPSDKMSKALGKTFEYAYADSSLALLAEDLGHTEDAEVFRKHSLFYRNLWNPESQYFHPRSSTGEFQEIDPLQLSYTDSEGRLTDDLVEGSALQWRWAIPFDPEGLVSLFKSREYFVQELEAYFEGSSKNVGNWTPGPYYWHGNEPYIHSAYLFNAAGRPDLTQKWVRWVLNHKYSDDYVGLDGNDDGGTLSAWYVLSALGFYPIAGSTRYEIGSPLFDRAVVSMGEATLVIEAVNQAPENVYVQKVTLNGAALETPTFDHRSIAGGGILRFEMGPEPVIPAP